MYQLAETPRTEEHGLSGSRLRIALTTLIVALLGPALSQAVSAPESLRFGICEREGPRLVGVKPIRPGKGVHAPTKLRNVGPSYPELPARTRGSGMWMGEVLLDTKGKVSHVWAIREVQFTPPFSTFNQAIVDAIQQWEFEPLIVKAKPMPVCMTVTVNIDWQ